jgi:glycosyltransferase involved in cell wall biosynthesis
MKCPKVKDLPLPRHGERGWPWTEETSFLPYTMPDGRPWPKISIVTPSYNQSEFIEETIRSVLLQGYPDSEYIIIDGGSTDKSIEIIKKYEPWLTYWVSEPDRGQAHAINKGFKKATGEIVAWINSDDVYFPGVLGIVANLFYINQCCDIVYGNCIFIDDQGKSVKRYRTNHFDFKKFLVKHSIPQPSMFFKQQILCRFGYLDENLDYSFDRKLWLMAGINCNQSLFFARRNFSKYRLHKKSKGVSEKHKMDIEISKMVLEIMENKKISTISKKDKEKATRFHKLTLALRYWQSDDTKKAKKCFKEAEIIEPALLDDKDLVGTIAFNVFIENVEGRDWKHGLKLLKSFYKEIIEPKVPGSKKYMTSLLSHYYFLVSFRRKNPILFLQGIIRSPRYFLKVSSFIIKRLFNLAQ